MPNVGLINWSGHKNLGDDAMTKILLDEIPNSVNMKEDPWEADYYILGGGTLISPGSLFPGRIPDPKRTIGVSLGVSSNWQGENADILRQMKQIYARDFFSHRRLLNHRIPNTLSVDLLCALEPEKPPVTDGIWANLMFAPESINMSHRAEVFEILHELEKTGGVNYFAMSPDEDLATKPNAYVYHDAQLLVNDLSGATLVYATRLHANVCAWVAGAAHIVPISYDPKVDHFYERVMGLTPHGARKIIREHLQEICQILK